MYFFDVMLVLLVIEKLSVCCQVDLEIITVNQLIIENENDYCDKTSIESFNDNQEETFKNCDYS